MTFTKNEALTKLDEGHKLTHRYFTEEEWMVKSVYPLHYEFEDGVVCPVEEFWRLRSDIGWETGWSIWDGQ